MRRPIGLLLFAVIVLAGIGVGLAYELTRPGTPTHRVIVGTVTHRQVTVTPRTKVTVTAPPVRKTPVVLPVGDHLVIPSIGVNAPIESVGLSGGYMAVPSKSPWTDVGWYDLGTAPGQKGSAVIDGHLDRPGGSPAVFWNLKLLKIGALVQVVETQRTLTFRVTRTAWLPNNAPTRAIFGNNTGTYLNLITCGGTWIPVQHQTTLRLVVFTTLV